MSAEDARTEVVDRMRGLFLPPRDMPQGMESKALAEYVDALKGYSKDELEHAWRSVRDTHKTRAWPTIAQFRAALEDGSKRRAKAAGVAANSEGRPTENGFQPWSGCQCERCANKAPSDGFFRASRGEREAAAALQSEVEDWFWRLMYGPGTPPVPAFTGEEIFVSPQRAAAVIAETRRRYPRTKRWRGRSETVEREPPPIPYVPTPPEVAKARAAGLAKLRGDPLDELSP